MKTQKQMFYEAHRNTNDLLQDAAFLCGLLGDNPNPLTLDEIKRNALAGKPYSWAFQVILEGVETENRMSVR